MPKYTPAPWNAENAPTSSYSPYSITKQFTIIASVGYGDTPLLEAAENARLIAAAPELLEALQGLLTVTQDTSVSHDVKMRKIAQSVITKVIGE